jgi:hypothetical protein
MATVSLDMGSSNFCVLLQKIMEHFQEQKQINFETITWDTVLSAEVSGENIYVRFILSWQFLSCI